MKLAAGKPVRAAKQQFEGFVNCGSAREPLRPDLRRGEQNGGNVALNVNKLLTPQWLKKACECKKDEDHSGSIHDFSFFEVCILLTVMVLLLKEDMELFVSLRLNNPFCMKRD